ncbi:glycoside hydrolase family 48 protein [Actinospica robiniae]|uniref:glycoside hydrolase family 48 protein n=1 Tax=Actinospica robiniae TaxID=304901 RepID=UPI0003FBBC06|nr:glycoside hydrolase family 48 protein [Actinospica robiniae]
MAESLSRRRFAVTAGTALMAVGGLPTLAKARAATAGAATPAAAATDAYTQAFLTQYAKIKNSANGYFSPEGIPYHCVETLIVEAPDHGHQTTSEAFSFWFWLEATYGRVTGDWTAFNNAWTTAEHYIIPQHVDQPSNSSYNASSPATYAPEWPDPSDYPSPLDSSVAVGQDPLAGELTSTYGTSDIYGMHWLMDVDNTYGYGNTPGTGAEAGPTATGPSYINSYQRGSAESVWLTIPQPCTDLFKYGGTNGYLDLFVKQSSAYSQQWKYTNAPDADARAVQAAYWAYTWAAAQGSGSQVSASVAKAAKMGDFLRYSLFDKYFKQIGNCTSASGCAAGSSRSSEHYLLAWYYAWGGAEPGGGWAWRIGDGASHQGYQNPLAAYAMSNVAALTPMSPTAKGDWASSLGRQLEFLQWLQSAEGALAGGCTNSWNGSYSTPPSGDSTFYGMAYDWEPVYHDPPSNNWFGMQAWGVERLAEYYYVTGNATAKKILDKWMAWAASETTVTATNFSIPSTLGWSGQPDTWNPSSPGSNTGLHVSIADYGNDVGVCAAYVKALTYYAAKSGNTTYSALAKSLLDAMSTFADSKGIAVPEVRTDYSSFGATVYVPSGWSGKMPNGDVIAPGATFLSIRSWYKNDPDFPKVQAYLNGGAAPSFTYHRFWAQADIAMAYAVYADLIVNAGTTTGGDTTPPSAPTNLKATGETSTTVSLSWTASTDNVAVTGYHVLRNSTQVGTTTSTTYTDTGLTASTAYSYTVIATDAAGNLSTSSNTVSATTSAGSTGDTTPPSAPTNLKATGETSTTVSLSWTASTDNVAVTGYKVFRNGTQVGTSTSTTYTDTGLTASTAYSYTVTANDAAGNNSTASNAVSATTSAAGGGTGTGTVKVQYANLDTAPTDNQIKPGLQVVNTGTAALALSTVTVRYWFTSDGGASTFSTYCDYAVVGSGNVTHSVVAMATPKTGADHYLQVGFTSGAGSLAAGASTGQIQNRLNKTDWSSFSETNDYSYGTNTAYTDWTKVTVYVNGTLAYGTEPS